MEEVTKPRRKNVNEQKKIIYKFSVDFEFALALSSAADVCVRV